MNPFPLPSLFAALRRGAAWSILFLAVHGTAPAQTWQDQDIGAVGFAGDSSEAAGVVTVRGSGADIWGAADGFHYRFITLEGNGALVARITSPGGGHPWAKVGLMMREAAAPGAKNVLAYATPGNHAGFQARATAGAASAVVADVWSALPVWLLLDRTGDNFQAYRSADGENWVPLGSTTVVMPERIMAGIAVSSHNNAVVQEATLDNLMRLGAEPPSAPVRARVAWTTSTSASIDWDNTALEATGFEVERAPDEGGPFARVGATDGNTVSYVDTGLTPNTRYYYRVRALGANGASDYSNVAWTVTPAEQVPTPGDFQVVMATATSLDLRWTDNASDETGYELERRLQGAASYTVIAVRDANTVSFNDQPLNPNTGYDYRVRAVRSGVYSNYASLSAATTPPDAGNWASGDIGVVGSPGQTQAGSDGNSFTLVAGGGDMWGGADALRLHYRQWSGDGLIAARVTGLANTDPWAKAGVMIRATFDSTSPNAAMVLTPGGNTAFQARTAPGGATTSAGGPRVSLPYWVAVSRAGNLFKGFVSSDGINWTQVGSAEIAMPNTAFIGLAASAHSNSGAQTTAVFDHVSAPDVMPPPPAPTWAQQTWGGTTGSYTQAGADLSLVAQGGDIWGTSDSGLFVFREWTGDVTLMGRMGRFLPAHTWTKVGFMIRASGEANAANVFVAFTHWNGNVLQVRPTAGAQTTTQQLGRPGSGGWLKLVRAGNAFTGYYSIDDRATWVPFNTVTVELPATVQVGVALSSHDPSAQSTGGLEAIAVE